MRRRTVGKIGIASPAEIEYYLLFNAAYNDIVSAFPGDEVIVADGVYYLEVDFEYSAVDSSYAPLITGTVGEDSQPRQIVNETLAYINSGLPIGALSYSVGFPLNTRTTIKVRRDALNDVYLSKDGGAETNIGNKTGSLKFNLMATSYDGRHLTGRLYSVDINGHKFDINEGSGSTVTSDTGLVWNIGTDHVDGATYINDVMWNEV